MAQYTVEGSYITSFEFTMEADSLADARARAEQELRQEYLSTDVLINGYEIHHIDVFPDDDDEDEPPAPEPVSA